MNCWIGLGSNLGDGPALLWQALRGITLAPRLRILRVSSLYQTEPWGVADQPAFTNAVIEADTTLEPLELLDHLQHVERDMGRVRTGRRWGPRLIDLDLLLCGEVQLENPRLIIPHPRMHQRAFVMAPLAELYPDLLVPGRGRVIDILAGLDSDSVRRLDTVLAGQADDQPASLEPKS